MNAVHPITHPGLPPMAWIDNALVSPRSSARTFETDATVILVRRGESGFQPIYTRLTADELNADAGVSAAQREAMLAGSMFGWEIPAANPDRWVGKV